VAMIDRAVRDVERVEPPRGARRSSVSVGQLAASPRQRTLAGDAMPLVDTDGTWVQPGYGARDRRNRTLVLVRWVCVAPTLSAQLHLWQSIQDG
jgi:hypothetical protein